MNLSFINNIILPNWIEEYDEEVIAKIKHDAQMEGRILKKYSDPKFILQRSVELSKSTAHENLDSIQKLVFISNAMFPEDKAFLYSMNRYGWTDEKTNEINSLIFKIKLLKKKNINIDIDTSLLEEIQRISKVCFGINNPAILINRLNELSVTKKDKMENTVTKKY